MLTAKEIIEYFDLKPLPLEGGHFMQWYRSDERIAKAALPERYISDKFFGTAILYLLNSDPASFSALHKLPTDELFHFYLGDPIEMLLLFPDGSSEKITLGQDLLGGQKVQFMAPRGVWQGSRLIKGGVFALIGTTMAPGFDYSDLVLGNREALIKSYPERGDLIRALSR